MIQILRYSTPAAGIEYGVLVTQALTTFAGVCKTGSLTYSNFQAQMDINVQTGVVTFSASCAAFPNTFVSLRAALDSGLTTAQTVLAGSAPIA